MGMIKTEMSGSFPFKTFSTTAEEGGHVMAIKRAILFLSNQLGNAVVADSQLTREGEAPPEAPLGHDKVEEATNAK